MTINIQKCANVTVIGHRTHKNCKPVYCIDTGEIYASALDAAKANGVTTAPMSNVLTGKYKTCNGKRFCYVSKITEHLEEIAEANRIREAKVTAYDMIAEKQSKINKHNARIAELQAETAKETAARAEAQQELDALFAQSAFSSDNAAGIALLCEERYRKEHGC